MTFAGFTKLRKGRIHLFCPGCGRKLSNTPRDEGNDPKTAVLARVFCLRCSEGGKDLDITYLNASGKQVEKGRSQWQS